MAKKKLPLAEPRLYIQTFEVQEIEYRVMFTSNGMGSITSSFRISPFPTDRCTRIMVERTAELFVKKTEIEVCQTK